MSFYAEFRMLSEKAMTFNFPPEMPLTEGFRGRHVLDMEKCVGCGLCEKICPNLAITMVERGEADEKRSYPQVDYGKCCFCGLCEDICPREALKLSHFPFIVVLGRDALVYPPEKLAEPPKLEHPVPPKIKGITNWAISRSFWVNFFFTGCCFIEAAPWVGSGFDMERFGMLAKGSPRHSDVLLIGGYVTVKTLRRILRIYEQMPCPKYVITLGCCPVNGGTYWDSYNTINNLEKYMPVDIMIAGCPPRPEPIGLAVVLAMNAVQSGYMGKEEKVNKEEGFLEVPSVEESREEGEYTIPFGPQHPASGNFDVYFKVEGERVKSARPNPGYLHRGFEKLMEYRTWWQNIMLVQRVCVLDGASYELSYIGAVEKLAGVEVSRRVKYLRTIQAELCRIQSHLLNLGLIGGATGFDTMVRIAWGDRERILLLLEKLTGGRIYHIYNIPGGVRRDLPLNFKDDFKKEMKYMLKQLDLYDNLCFNNSVFNGRTKELGVLPGDMAVRLDVTGPNARASGVRFDVRKASPYETYDELDFNVVTSEGSDAYSRALCRRKEIEESLYIVENALEKIPSGKLFERNAKGGLRLSPFSPLPKGETIHCVESARGELCFHLVSNGKNTPYRAKIRGPTFDSILVAMPKVLEDEHVAEIPVIYWSLDNCPADHDR
ncbi:MAG: NADH-quinone oxidoreductase subunit D [Candidatus Hecatellaceae archaeon]